MQDGYQWKEDELLFTYITCKYSNQFSLPAIRNLAKNWRLSYKPRMRSADSIPIVSTNVFLPLKMYTGITKILEFEYKTCMF